MEPTRRILVATDFSPDSRLALEGARALARRAPSHVEALYVWHPRELSLTTPSAREKGKTLGDLARQEAHRRLRHFLGRNDDPDVRPRIEVGVPYEVIVTLAASERFDLIVMGAAGAGANPSRMGTVARRVLGASPCPVLTFRAPPAPPSSLAAAPGAVR